MAFMNVARWAVGGSAAGGAAFGLSRLEKSLNQDDENVVVKANEAKVNVKPEDLVINNDTYSHLNKLKPWDWNWDHRHYDENTDQQDDTFIPPKKVYKKAYRNIFLIRHGQYFDTEKEDENRKLTDLGHEQAKYTGIRLSHHFNFDMEVSRQKYEKKLEKNSTNSESEDTKEAVKPFSYPKIKLYQSSMTRAIETAEEIKEIFKTADIDWEFSGQSDLIREGPPYPTEPPLSSWQPESAYYEGSARIEAGFRALIHRADAEQDYESNEVVVCHANVIRYFVCRALQIPPEAWLRMSLNHGSITWIRISPKGTVSLRCLGDAGYMPIDKVSRR